MTAPTIDRATFDELKDTAGADFVVELIDTFLVEGPAMLDELRRALAAKEADTFRRTAHSLKSNSNTFGALTLGAMARELELSGMDPAKANDEKLDALAAEYRQVAATLTELKNA
ncbi:MAG TPA: Hpt domain-containing protein [Casimicrobiaceae bacterium]|nr:Hpt domain-containing protein [Casimicrobiaceae bacterium]